MYILKSLDPGVRRSLIEYCAKELNYARYGNYTPYYLWEASNRREAEVVLRAAEQFFVKSNGGPVLPPFVPAN